MADKRTQGTEILDPAAEKKEIAAQRKALKAEQKEQRKAAKLRAKELSEREERVTEEEGPGGLSIVLVTLLIVAIWVGIICLLIKLDVGGFGSNVLAPILGDVPVINKILPADSLGDSATSDEYGGYKSTQEAVAYIKQLELEVQQLEQQNTTGQEQIAALQEEINRLRTFEDSQVEFEAIRDEFYNEVVYGDKAPNASEYAKYYEAIDPDSAAQIYQQVVQKETTGSVMKDYVAAYSAMKAKDAAEIFNTMTNNLNLVAEILENMDSDSRGKILAEMDPDIAAQVTKLMEPGS
ncbi:MAG: hypothetical protein K6E33_04265 [Lachnospiraceae bacterium]|nr:hypothetical protein [Lachnospiraceae bacterium]